MKTLPCLRARLVLSLAVLLGWLACSDDTATKKDSRVPDRGADRALMDLGKPEAALPDKAMPDRATVDAALPDKQKPDAKLPDAQAKDLAPAWDGLVPNCQPVIAHCSQSLVWTGYISPFTLAGCSKLVTCVKGYYSGSCLTTFMALETCLGTIASASECDTKCAKEVSLLYTTCTCPKICGVPCP